MIYFDNAATTNYKPSKVIDAVNDALINYPFNPNRSGNKLCIQLQQKLLTARKKISILTGNGDEMRVVFTSGCTNALNLAILGTAKKGHIVITSTEHNSVLRTVMQLRSKGYADVSIVQPDEDGIITPQAIADAMKQETYLVCVCHASNVTGQSQDVASIGEVVRKHGALLLVDCAQSIGYLPVNMQRWHADMVAIPSHKGLHGIQGAGALVLSDRVNPRPVVYGGTGTDSHLVTQPITIPDGLEAGTLPCPAILGMSSAITWWAENYRQNHTVIDNSVRILIQGLSEIDGVKVYSKPNDSGIVAFNVKNVDSNEIADRLAEKDIAVRGGLQCAPLMHKHLGTYSQGVVRASTSCVTTKEDCYKLIRAVTDIAHSYR